MVNVGEDEFCTNCMEWRKYDEKGKCTVCGKIIRQKPKNEKGSYAEYERVTDEFEEADDF